MVSSKIVEIFKMIFKYKEIAKEWRLKVLKEMERSLKRYISQATFFYYVVMINVTVKWGFRSDFQKATPSPYSLPIAFKWWLIIEDK